ncbi:MAG: 5-deoxy-glucuronate isomerase [Solirubrobacteraceae bacterium]
MSLLVRGGAPGGAGTLVEVTPASAGWEYVGFEAVGVAPDAPALRETGGRELCVVALGGRVTVRLNGAAFAQIGGRADVFSGLPHAAYVPPGTSVSLEAHGGPAETALAWAPAEGGLPAAELPPDGVEVEVRGAGVTERRIHPILMDGRDAERLLVVEVLTPAGHWSSYPPHKHDRDDPPSETRLEETYYHRLRQPGRFALQRVYSEDRSLDESLAVGDGDVVLVPRGYHPVSAPPDVDLYYLNVMAGPRREWRFVTDPAFG